MIPAERGIFPQIIDLAATLETFSKRHDVEKDPAQRAAIRADFGGRFIEMYTGVIIGVAQHIQPNRAENTVVELEGAEYRVSQTAGISGRSHLKVVGESRGEGEDTIRILGFLGTDAGFDYESFEFMREVVAGKSVETVRVTVKKGELVEYELINFRSSRGDRVSLSWNMVG